MWAGDGTTWTQLDAMDLGERSAHAALALGDEVVVLGGRLRETIHADVTEGARACSD